MFAYLSQLYHVSIVLSVRYPINLASSQLYLQFSYQFAVVCPFVFEWTQVQALCVCVCHCDRRIANLASDPLVCITLHLYWWHVAFVVRLVFFAGKVWAVPVLVTNELSNQLLAVGSAAALGTAESNSIWRNHTYLIC